MEGAGYSQATSAELARPFQSRQVRTLRPDMIDELRQRFGVLGGKAADTQALELVVTESSAHAKVSRMRADNIAMSVCGDRADAFGTDHLVPNASTLRPCKHHECERMRRAVRYACSGKRNI